MRFVGIASEISSKSKCQALLRIANKIMNRNKHEFIIADIKKLPYFDPINYHNEGSFPPEVKKFRDQVEAADGILFAVNELPNGVHNYSISGPLQNTIDWTGYTRNLFAEKPIGFVHFGSHLSNGESCFELRKQMITLQATCLPGVKFSGYATLLIDPHVEVSTGDIIDPKYNEYVHSIISNLMEHKPPPVNIIGKDKFVMWRESVMNYQKPQINEVAPEIVQEYIPKYEDA